jgi:hypothetical protein
MAPLNNLVIEEHILLATLQQRNRINLPRNFTASLSTDHQNTGVADPETRITP